jgi:hypothetical protein
MRAPRTIGPSSAAALCGISPALLRWRAEHGKIRIARRSPLRFRPDDVLAARERMAIKDPRGRRSSFAELERLVS